MTVEIPLCYLNESGNSNVEAPISLMPKVRLVAFSCADNRLRILIAQEVVQENI